MTSVNTSRVIGNAAVDHLRAVGADIDADHASRYTRLEQLGEGGMGAVYRCWDVVLERDVAMKVALVIPGSDSALLAERLRSEARILARLEHAGIVPVHDAGRLPDGRVFYVMKRIRGRTLSEALRQGLSLARRLDIFERVAEAVAFAHTQGVVHRDLKPDNIMVGDFGEVLVADWGVAKVLGEHRGAPLDTKADDESLTPPLSANVVTEAGTLLGTPGYMSPEQAIGRAADTTPAADVFALGAVLVTLGGEGSASATRSALALLNDARELPPPLRSIARRCLEPDPTSRYPDAGALLDELRRYRNGDRVLAHPEGMVARLQRILRPWRTPILLMVAYLAMRMVVAWVGIRRTDTP